MVWTSFSLKLPHHASLLVLVGQPQVTQASAILLGSPLDCDHCVWNGACPSGCYGSSLQTPSLALWAALRDRKSGPPCLVVIKL